jgi:RNA polymerase sigma factor (sigma-70 family)
MDEKKLLTRKFEEKRGHLRSVAYRMLGSMTDADDAVQEAWLRLNRTDVGDVGNLGGWLTTVVARVCLDMLRSRKSRREDPILEGEPESAVEFATGSDDPEREIVLADSVGLALLVVLETLNPAERVAFVLHDMFDLPFDEIAPIVGRSPEASRQLASRARRRVQGADVSRQADNDRRRQVVDAFLAASRGGDFEGLLRLLDPDVTFHADAAAMRLGGMAEMRGADAVAKAFQGRARSARPALIDGLPGYAVYAGEKLLLVARLSFNGHVIAGIDAVADPDALANMELELA